MIENSARTVALPGGTVLALAVAGQGDIPLIFIHGYSMSLESWARVIERLPSRYKAYSYDLRGFGNSSRPGKYELRDHAADLVGLLDSLELDRAVLIGHSLGSSIAQLVSITQPDRVAALVLTNSRARTLPPPDLGAGGVEPRLAGYGSIEDNRRVLRARMPDYFDASNVEAADIERFVEWGLRADSEALKGTLRSIYSTPAIPGELFRNIKAPALIVCGANDHVTPLAKTIPILEFMAAELVMIADCGHTPMFERPDEWSRAVYSFLDRKVVA